MYEGDGSNGIAPAHAIGVHADVARELGNDDGKITVDAEVLNGRAPSSTRYPHSATRTTARRSTCGL